MALCQLFRARGRVMHQSHAFVYRLGGGGALLATGQLDLQQGSLPMTRHASRVNYPKL